MAPVPEGGFQGLVWISGQNGNKGLFFLLACHGQPMMDPLGQRTLVDLGVGRFR